MSCVQFRACAALPFQYQVDLVDPGTLHFWRHGRKGNAFNAIGDAAIDTVKMGVFIYVMMFGAFVLAKGILAGGRAVYRPVDQPLFLKGSQRPIEGHPVIVGQFFIDVLLGQGLSGIQKYIQYGLTDLRCSKPVTTEHIMGSVLFHIREFGIEKRFLQTNC